MQTATKTGSRDRLRGCYSQGLSMPSPIQLQFQERNIAGAPLVKIRDFLSGSGFPDPRIGSSSSSWKNKPKASARRGGGGGGGGNDAATRKWKQYSGEQRRIAKISEPRAPMTFKKASSFDSGKSTFDISLISLGKRNKERSILLFPQNSSI
ncbi:unnamed protein product [Sphagnum balticum]